MFGNLSESEIDDLLNSQLVGRLGLHDGSMPYIIPISYAFDGKSIFCHTEEGMKMDMMRKNPLVCFQVDNLENLSRWRSVICWGNAIELTSSEERDEAINELLNRKLPVVSSETTHISPIWPFHPHNLADVKGIILKIEISKKTGRFENSESFNSGY